MNPSHLQQLEGVLIACAAAYLMIQSGQIKHLLQWKRRPFCPSCGRESRDCSCRQRLHD